MENIKLFISLAFRKEGKPEAHPEAIFNLEPITMRNYLEALKKEIIASSVGTEDCLVTEIEFGIGSFTHQVISDMEDLYRLIQTHYHVDKKVRVTLFATPAGLDFYKFTIGRHFNQAAITMEFPSFDPEDLKSHGYSSTEASIQGILKQAFDLQYPALECRIEPNQHLQATLEILAPAKISAICFMRPLTQQQKDLGETTLSPYGFKWDQQAFRKQPFHSTPLDQIGCGINAVTIFENIAYQNTADLSTYLEYSEDFEKIAHPIQPLQEAE